MPRLRAAEAPAAGAPQGAGQGSARPANREPELALRQEDRAFLWQAEHNVVAEVGGRRLVRELFPVNSYRPQAGGRVHFGLGEADALEVLKIRWPSGREQRLEAVKADRHTVVRESEPDVEKVVPGTTIRP